MTTRRTLNTVAPRALPFGTLFLAMLLLAALPACDSAGPETSGDAPPIANAGPDLTADECVRIDLDGSGSSDPDGDPLTYEWSIASGPGSGEFQGSTTEAMTVFYTSSGSGGTYEVVLTVSDGTNSDTDVAMITVNDVLPVEIGGTISSDSTLANTSGCRGGVDYHVTRSINVTNAATLTIEADVRMAFAPNTYIEVGRGSASALRTLGDINHRIVMTTDAESPAPGHWAGLRFWGNTHPDTRLQYLELEGCGQGQDGCLWSYGGVVTVEWVQISHSGSYGVNFAPPGARGAFGPGSRRLRVFESALPQLRIHPDHAGTIPEDSDFHPYPAESHRILLTEGAVTRSQTWPNVGAPYQISDRVGIVGSSNPILTLLPGTELRFGDGAFLEVGRGDGGVLQAVGTPESPIVFTSASSDPRPGDWGDNSGGIAFWSAAANGNQISHAVIEHATNLVWFFNDIGVIVTNSTLRNASDCAFRWYTSANHETDQSDNNTFANNAGGNQCEG